MNEDPYIGGLVNADDIAPWWFLYVICAIIGVFVLAIIITPKGTWVCPDGYALDARNRICIKDAVEPTLVEHK